MVDILETMYHAWYIFCWHPAQVQQGQGGAAAGGGDLQAQWADYYRQLGYFYGGQQQSGSGGATGQPPNPGGTNGGPAGPGGSAGGDGEHKVSVMMSPFS